jgi:phage baseplate assembly protein W
VADILGRGLLRPFQRDLKSDLANGGGAALVAACVEQVLGTERSHGTDAGEVPWDDELGSRLHHLRHKGANATTQELARVFVAEAFAQEPRAKLRRVEVTEEERDGAAVLLVRVGFDVVARNEAGNEVLVPGLEAVVPIG